MKTVLRYDRGDLRGPEITSQGFLKAQGHVGRAGIYEYRDDGGALRRELRPLEEIQSPGALASFEAAPVTIGHPADQEVTAENVRRHEVGTVSGPAWSDDDHVAATVVTKDARAIKLVRAGKQELSPGYRIKLDETPGADRRYAYPGNPEGRWDAIQRGHRVNHLAIVDRARGGSTIRLRMDALDARADGGKLTTSADGHQHLVDVHGWDGVLRTSGETSWSVSEGATSGHSHAWVRATDGTIALGEAEGHTHGIIDGDTSRYEQLIAGAGTQIDRSDGARESGRMDPQEQIRSLQAQLAAAEAKLTPIQDAATKHQARADSAEATVSTLRSENGELRAQIAAAAVVVETEAIKREKIRADSAEDKLRRLDEATANMVEARVVLERKIGVVMGHDFQMRGVPERQLIATAVKRLDAQADVGPAVSDAYLMGKLESLLDLHARNARSSQRVADIITDQNKQRADADDEARSAYRNRWQDPLPNSREAQAARKGT